jgi:hypothetical protein
MGMLWEYNREPRFSPGTAQNYPKWCAKTSLYTFIRKQMCKSATARKFFCRISLSAPMQLACVKGFTISASKWANDMQTCANYTVSSGEISSQFLRILQESSRRELEMYFQKHPKAPVENWHQLGLSKNGGYLNGKVLMVNMDSSPKIVRRTWIIMDYDIMFTCLVQTQWL